MIRDRFLSVIELRRAASQKKSRRGRSPPASVGTLSGLFLLELVVDHFLELFDRNSAVDDLTIDEKRRGRTHADFFAVGQVLLHEVSVLLRLEALLELSDVSSSSLGMGLEAGWVELVL